MKLLIIVRYILSNVKVILGSKKSFGEITPLLMTFLRLSLKYLLSELKIISINSKEEKIFDYSVAYLNFKTFWGLFAEIFVLREYEFKTDNAKPMIIDCGGNIGMSVLYFKRLYPDARIICFEPHHETFEILKKNVERNHLKDIRLYEAAVLDNEGMIPFYSDLDNIRITGMSVTQRLLENGSRIKKESVKSELLSHHITEKVDFLKMDIEGAETQVMQDLQRNEKLDSVNEMVIEYHYDMTNPVNDLGSVLVILRDTNFKYIVSNSTDSPFYLHKNKAYGCMIYAYK